MKILIISLFFLLFSLLPKTVLAVTDCTDQAYRNDPANKVECAFGTVSPPPALQNIIKNDPTGAGGISTFLSNLIALFYSAAAIVLIFMLLWGAFEWMTSGGDKEKLSSAQRRVISAIVGIILFAATFAIIAVLGTFTGFKFFGGQNYTIMSHPSPGRTELRCSNGIVYTIDTSVDPYTFCLTPP